MRLFIAIFSLLMAFLFFSTSAHPDVFEMFKRFSIVSETSLIEGHFSSFLAHNLNDFIATVSLIFAPLLFVIMLIKRQLK